MLLPLCSLLLLQLQLQLQLRSPSSCGSCCSCLLRCSAAACRALTNSTALLQGPSVRAWSTQHMRQQERRKPDGCSGECLLAGVNVLVVLTERCNKRQAAHIHCK
jgi:hypothetical protein